MSSNFVDLKKLSPDEQQIANRITKLAQIVATAQVQPFKVTVWKEGAKPEVLDSSGDSVAKTEDVFLAVIRADATTGKLAELLRGKQDR